MIYAAYAKDDNVRSTSSSGGMYYLLANNIIEKQGIVFATIYSDLIPVYKKITQTREVLLSQGSKYTTPYLYDTFTSVKNALKDNEVMFVGLPCHCAGLKMFLGKKYDNLLVVSLVCHGVPSRYVWREYSKTHEINEVNMRAKTNGWRNYAWNIKMKNGVERSIDHNSVLYMSGFANDLYLRPSCHECKFKNHLGSDITLGDFWGIEKVAPEMDDDKGTSIVIINTEKGSLAFSEIKEKCFFQVIDNQQCMSYNLGFNVAPLSWKRKRFFKLLNQRKDLDKIIMNLTGKTILGKIVNKSKKIMVVLNNLGGYRKVSNIRMEVVQCFMLPQI